MSKEIKPGIVYVLENPAFPDLVKIGFTRRTVAQRMKELDDTNLPAPFTCSFARHCDNPEIVEQDLHSIFDEWRVNRNREFFRISSRTAFNALTLMGGGMLALIDDTPKASEKPFDPAEHF